MKLKVFKQADILICGLILMGLGIFGLKSVNASSQAQHNIQNKYVMAKVMPDKTSRNHLQQDYVGKFSNHHLQYISLDKLNAKRHKGTYFTIFNHVYAHKLGGHIITTSAQLRKAMPQKTQMMNPNQLHQALLQAKMLHCTYLSQAGHKHTLIQIAPVPVQSKHMVHELMVNHKSTMKKIIKANKKQMELQQQQIKKMRALQGKQGNQQSAQSQSTQE